MDWIAFDKDANPFSVSCDGSDNNPSASPTPTPTLTPTTPTASTSSEPTLSASVSEEVDKNDRSNSINHDSSTVGLPEAGGRNLPGPPMVYAVHIADIDRSYDGNQHQQLQCNQDHDYEVPDEAIPVPRTNVMGDSRNGDPGNSTLSFSSTRAVAAARRWRQEYDHGPQATIKSQFRSCHRWPSPETRGRMDNENEPRRNHNSMDTNTAPAGPHSGSENGVDRQNNILGLEDDNYENHYPVYGNEDSLPAIVPTFDEEDNDDNDNGSDNINVEDGIPSMSPRTQQEATNPESTSWPSSKSTIVESCCGGRFMYAVLATILGIVVVLAVVMVLLSQKKKSTDGESSLTAPAPAMSSPSTTAPSLAPIPTTMIPNNEESNDSGNGGSSSDNIDETVVNQDIQILSDFLQMNVSIEETTRIQLDNQGLQGTIPSQIGLLKNLRRIDLGPNLLTGTIPTELGLLSLLRFIDLGPNQLKGKIPSQLGLLSSLTYLDLGPNKLTGSIPTQIGLLSSLDTIDLGTNTLSGSIPIELHQLTLLNRIFLGPNQLDGSLSTAIIASWTNATRLDFLSNQLSGSLPPEVGLMTALTWLDARRNQFSDIVPTTLGLLQDLQRLDLSSNEFLGTIPSELGLLSALTFLDLSNNRLYGTIPPEVTRLRDNGVELLVAGNDGIEE